MSHVIEVLLQALADLFGPTRLRSPLAQTFAEAAARLTGPGLDG